MSLFDVRDPINPQLIMQQVPTVDPNIVQVSIDVTV